MVSDVLLFEVIIPKHQKYILTQNGRLLGDPSPEQPTSVLTTFQPTNNDSCFSFPSVDFKSLISHSTLRTSIFEGRKFILYSFI